ncbi:cache domain-containing protein [Thalassolituus pacificus]|uniref:histidine kinase n=1 Tax=Thalassolituus pacificus TaxID=2975440 RepID=A0A9X2WI54_9GAMM|nr:cache domain-containing protein [Thalassolituus pacificus]MCT7360921.1 cache domain-containing protein [Thalassolituus pacificus]
MGNLLIPPRPPGMNLTLKAKILLLTVLPLVALTLTITWITQRQAQQLAQQQVAIFEENVLASKRKALVDYVSLAMTSINPVLEELEYGLNQSRAEYEVKRILQGLTYGNDGYFFVYDQYGTNLVHPAQPDLVGQPMIDFQDDNGQYVIRDLLALAEKGGGFYRYIWNKPSLSGQENKLSYVVNIPYLNWMMGTGLYVDDIAAETRLLQNKVNSNVRRTFLAASVLLAVTLALVVIIVIIINMHATQLADQRLQDLAHRSVAFQVMQRRTFARELHDGINQMLVSAKLRLNLADKKWPDEDAREHLHKASDMLNMSIQEVRRVSHNLRPVMLDDLGLEPALHSLLDNIKESGKIRVKRRIRLPETRLPDAIEMTLYRLVQEAITNVQKHAEATQVSLNISHNQQSIVIEMEDNGCGFSLEEDQSGIGLMNMRERVELVGGKFSVRSRRTQGTLIHAEFFLNPDTALREADLL